MNPRLPLYLLTAALILLGGLIVLYFYMDTSGPREKPVTSTGEALVGGPFELTDHKGNTVTEKDFAGRFMLIYFGYSFCPDVCPTELQKMALALRQFEQQGGDMARLSPLFITIDPERDTVDVMADYVQAFPPKLTGLTGTVEQIAKAAKAYRVYYAKGDDPGDGAYLMDHSSIIFLMDGEGRYVRHFTLSDSPESMTEALLAAIG